MKTPYRIISYWYCTVLIMVATKLASIIHTIHKLLIATDRY